MEQATFAAGCFWGVEAALRSLPGVIEATVGYTGGEMPDPTYEDVCTDRTGHAEAVLLRFDPAQVSYEELLDFFFAHHDPTTLNRQGPDAGTQYRSAIFYHTPRQEAAARAKVSELTGKRRYRRPIVTQIVPAGPFYRAEEYHQRYLEKRGAQSCHLPPRE